MGIITIPITITITYNLALIDISYVIKLVHGSDITHLISDPIYLPIIPLDFLPKPLLLIKLLLLPLVTVVPVIVSIILPVPCT